MHQKVIKKRLNEPTMGRIFIVGNAMIPGMIFRHMTIRNHDKQLVSEIVVSKKRIVYDYYLLVDDVNLEDHEIVDDPIILAFFGINVTSATKSSDDVIGLDLNK